MSDVTGPIGHGVVMSMHLPDPWQSGGGGEKVSAKW